MKGNVLKIRTIKKNSEWCDKPEVMLHANFQILVDFVEKEKPQTIVDVKTHASQRKWWKETLALYRYWKVERPKMEKQMTRALMRSAKKNKMVFGPSNGLTGEIKFITKDKKARNAYWRLEDRFKSLEDEMLQRLINIRHHLWC